VNIEVPAFDVSGGGGGWGSTESVS
jgi:hypothetical protein